MSNKFAKFFYTFLFALMIAPTAHAEERATPEQAIAFVNKGVAHYRQVGKEKAFADFADVKNKQFHDRDLYMFVYDMKGINIAHGNNPKMVGKNLYEMKDGNGKPIIKGFIDLAKSGGSGWVDYMWPNPVNQNIEAKSSYIVKVDDMIFGAGIYKTGSK
jgi:signal transduction histidine kinase